MNTIIYYNYLRGVYNVYNITSYNLLSYIYIYIYIFSLISNNIIYVIERERERDYSVYNSIVINSNILIDHYIDRYYNLYIISHISRYNI